MSGAASIGSVNVRPVTLLLGVGALVITACSTTALSSAPAPTTSEPAVIVPPLPDEAPEPVVLAEDDAPGLTTEPGDAEVSETSEVITDDEAVDAGTIEESLDEVTADEAAIDEAAIDEPEAQVVAFAREVRTVPALDPALRAMGTSSGSETVRLQERLLELGFWVQATDGNYGLTTRQGVMAFQKFYGLPADGVMNDATAALMSELTERPHGRADAGTLIEVDKTRQLLFIVIDGRTEWILNASTGTEIPYERPNASTPTSSSVDRRSPRTASTGSTVSMPTGGARATSARSTDRSTSSAVWPSTVRTASRTTRPRTVVCG